MNEEEIKSKHPGKAMTSGMPEMAIIESNTLAMMGLKQLLEAVMPMMNIRTFGSFDEFEANNPDRFIHYFVSMHIALAHRYFFVQGQRARHTIVLTPSNDPNSQLNDFHCLCVSVPEETLVKHLLALQKMGHPHGEHLPNPTANNKEKLLSDREIEVLALVAQGKINKEIADMLCIGLSTVITHRKNIQEKLNLKSVSSLTIYAVMHGYVDINHISG